MLFENAQNNWQMVCELTIKNAKIDVGYEFKYFYLNLSNYLLGFIYLK